MGPWPSSRVTSPQAYWLGNSFGAALLFGTSRKEEEAPCLVR